MNATDWAEQYRLIRPKYVRLCERVSQLITELLNRDQLKFEIEHRAKAESSFAEKIGRSGKNYKDPLSDITDLAGIRLVMHSLADVEAAVTIIRREFDVDIGRSLNKADQLDPDRFGYLSQHYILRLRENRAALPEWNDVGGLWLELQVRTTMQHAWAVIQHALDYKNSVDVPKKLRRRLYRVSALLELADEELDLFAKEVRSTVAGYEHKLRQGDSSIELNVESLRTFVTTAPIVAYWNDVFRRGSGWPIRNLGDLSRDVAIANFVGITTVEQLNHLFEEAKDWGEQFLLAYARPKSEEVKPPGSTTYIVLNGTMTLLLIGAHHEKFTLRLLEKDFGFSSTHILTDAATAKHSRHQPEQ